MSNEQFVEVTYGPVRLVPLNEPSEPPPPPKPAPPSQRRIVQRLNEWLQLIRSLSLNLLFFVPLTAVVLLVISELRRAPVVIEEIGLPRTLTDQGYTSAVAAHRLWDAMSEIQRQATTEKSSVSLLPDSRQLDVVEPGTGLSLQGLAQMLRASLNLDQTRITGEILCADSSCEFEDLRLRLRVFSGEGMQIRNLGKIGDGSVNAYFLRAAESAMEIVDPYVLANYYYENPETQEKALAMARDLVEDRHELAPWGAILVGFHRDEGGTDQQTLREAEELFEVVHNSKELYGNELPAAFWLNWGTTLEDLGQPREAIEKHRRATEIDPNYEFAWLGWGVSHADLGEYELAIEKYRKATEINAQFSSAWNNWGASLGRMGEHEQAIEKYERATEVDPDYSNAWYGWGFSLAKLGEHEDAIEKFAQATVLDGEYLSAWNNWGASLDKLGRHDDAANKFQTAASVDPKDFSAWLNWGIMLDKMGEHKDAVARFSRATEIDPEQLNAWLGWGFSLGKLGEHEEEVQKYQRVTELNPEFVMAWNAWGQGLNTLGQHDAAIEKFQRAIELDPGNEFAWNTWAIAADELRNKSYDCEPARAYMEVAGDRAPEWAVDAFSGISNACVTEQKSSAVTGETTVE